MIALLLSTAFAGQSGPASAYAGTYDVACETATLTLHVGLSGGDASTSHTWTDDFDVDLDCDGIDADEQAAIEAELAAACTDAGLPAGPCADTAVDLAASIAAFNQDTLAILPRSVTMKVGTYGWFWSGLLGLYPMTGTHRFDSGPQTWTYLLDNNDGQGGHFAAAGITVNGAGATDGLACVDVGTAGIDGHMVRGGDLTAAVAVDRSLACLASDGVVWIAGQAGITFDAAVVGDRR